MGKKWNPKDCFRWNDMKWNKILFIVCYRRLRVMAVWLWVVGKPPDDNEHSVTPHKQKVWLDLLFHNDHSEGHSHAISPTSTEEEEEPQSPVSDSQESHESARVWEFYNGKKINTKNGKELQCVLKCDCMKFVFVCGGACARAQL